VEKILNLILILLARMLRL